MCSLLFNVRNNHSTEGYGQPSERNIHVPSEPCCARAVFAGFYTRNLHEGIVAPSILKLHPITYEAQSASTYLRCDGSTTYRRTESFMNICVQTSHEGIGTARARYGDTKGGGLARAMGSSFDCRKTIPGQTRAMYTRPNSTVHITSMSFRRSLNAENLPRRTKKR